MSLEIHVVMSSVLYVSSDLLPATPSRRSRLEGMNMASEYKTSTTSNWLMVVAHLFRRCQHAKNIDNWNNTCTYPSPPSQSTTDTPSRMFCLGAWDQELLI